MREEWTGELEFRLGSDEIDGIGCRRLVCEGPFQTRVVIELYRTREGLWSWRWSESWLGHTTVSEPRLSWVHRDHAVDVLRRAAVLYRISALADYFLRWR